MYKKTISLILGIFLSLVLSFSIVKASEDGKLKIDMEIHKEKSSKIPKTAIAGSSTLLLTVGLLGMYISKRKKAK